MSWWDASSFSNLASQAFKNAQQRIDKVLDIKDEEGTSAKVAEGASASTVKESSTSAASNDKKEPVQDDAFWNTYLGGDDLMGFTSKPSKNESVSKPTARTLTPASGLLSAVKTERTELKTSATSAFTVRSKRVESTLKKFNVKSDLVDNPKDAAVNLEDAGGPKIPSPSGLPPLKSPSSDDKSSNKKDHTYEELITEPTNVECKELTIKDNQPDGSNIKTPDAPSVTQNEPVKTSAPLKLGRSLSSRKKDEEAEKKAKDEKAKAEAAAIETQIFSLLEDNTINQPDPAKTIQIIEAPAEKPPDLMVADDEVPDISGTSKWTSLQTEPNPDMMTSAGSGWEAEDLDIEELSDVDSVSESQPVDSSSTSRTKEDYQEGAYVSVKLPAELESTEGRSDELESSLTSSRTADQSEAVEVKGTDEYDKETSEPIAETDSVVVQDIIDEPATGESNKEDKEESLAKDEDMLVLSTSKPDIYVPGNKEVESVEKLQISFESSDTAEGTGDELSESSRTLTGEDFTSSTEDNENGTNKKEKDTKSSEPPTSENKDETVSKSVEAISSSDAPVDGDQVESETSQEDESEVQNEFDVKGNDSPESSEQATLMESTSSSSILGCEDKKGVALVSSSYVKTMLEEAMVESVKDTDSHTSTSSDKSSEMVRIESGMNSGHTSGDEIDTTTSSDIEIISTPTPNGEYRQERPFDLSPLRHALSRTMRRGSPPGHKRSDSSSSGQSTWSKNGDDLLGPDGGHHREGEGITHETLEEGPENTTSENPQSDLSATTSSDQMDEQTSGDPMETENLLKDTQSTERGAVAPIPPLPTGSHHPTTGPTLDTIVEKVEPNEIQALPLASRTLDDLALVRDPTNDIAPQELLEKLAEKAEVLDARERKLVELSKENIDLEEAKEILKNQLKQSEEAREAELEDLNTITEEFTARLADFEQRQQATVRERDSLKKQLAGVQNDLSKKTNSSSGMERLLKEKDQQISELLEEGEKLSKQQLQSNNIIKKLRTKEKDNDTLLKTQKTKLEQQSEELAHLRKVLDSKEDLEKRQIEAINQQNIAVKKQDSDILQLKGENEDLQEKARGLQAALDNSYKEISELHKAKAAAASENQSARLSVEMQAKQELQMSMERQQHNHKKEIEAFITQTEDLQMSIVRQEREQGRREDVLRQEIADLQQRLQEAEERNQDLTQSVTSATRPLLRQIENLQSTYSVQSGSYEKLERNLTERLNEAQTSLAEAQEKERAANERLLDIQARFTSVETQVSTLRQEKSRLTAQLEVEKTKLVVLEDAKNSETAQLEALKARSSDEVTGLKKEKLLLESQMEIEKMKTEAEKKKLMLAHEQLRDKELQLQRQALTPSPRSTREDSIHSEPSTPMSMSLTQEEILEKTLMMGSANGSSSSLYESLRHTGAASLLENLQSQLKLKEGEIVQLQSEIKDLEQTRESMARELVNLSSKNDELEQQLEEHPILKRAHKDLDARYQALLQMYGEKVEEAEELAMDLHDIKDMYKAQIEELLKRVR